MGNKNAMIHEIKEMVEKNNKHYSFIKGTSMVLDRYDEYLDTQLISLDIHKGKLVLETCTPEYGFETDNLSDFHTTIVEDIYNLVMVK